MLFNITVCNLKTQLLLILLLFDSQYLFFIFYKRPNGLRRAVGTYEQINRKHARFETIYIMLLYVRRQRRA